MELNEHIKELALLALDIVANKRVLSDGQIERTWDPHTYDQVFAELIVKECAEVAYNTAQGETTYGWMVGNRIKQHFGVEE